MAQTRGATGNSKPRVFPTVSVEPVRKRKATTGTGATGKKKKTATGGVSKKRAPAASSKGKSSVKDKIEGAVDKLTGSVENKPAKKAAGTKKISGTDGKTSKTAKINKV
ncbi:hypothetical protein PV10_07849 [Exophiala mesophila]|uniref:Uncharacterized protein n=1 Tax=Exophiala mesophila TaxID=212818 RepID=A0A0D1XR58_EXOME|nr:uncharacterized protein PV10_07849 [Exophiala mesophila]KIV90561.1 hypothetical protein PV10_07849 [Exophiala mesophila]